VSDKYGIMAELHNEAEHIGIDPTLSVTQSMADFYLLERLVADGSTKAKHELDALEKRLAPMFVEYLGAICLGEMRHVFAQDEDSDEAQLSCGCHCWDCHSEQSWSHDHCDSSCDPTDWSGTPAPDCEETDPNPIYHEDCCGIEPIAWSCYMDQGEIEYECGDSDPTDIEPEGGYAQNLPSALDSFLSNYTRSDRTGCWVGWVDFSRKHGTVKALNYLYKGFTDCYWQGGYGGSAWASIARVTRDYADHKISRRVFLNMVWSLQHNGGNVFNKMWRHRDCSDLQSALIRQSHDDYSFLTNFASVSARKIWRVRDYMLRNWQEHDDVWLGNQRTFTSEELAW